MTCNRYLVSRIYKPGLVCKALCLDIEGARAILEKVGEITKEDEETMTNALLAALLVQQYGEYPGPRLPLVEMLTAHMGWEDPVTGGGRNAIYSCLHTCVPHLRPLPYQVDHPERNKENILILQHLVQCCSPLPDDYVLTLAAGWSQGSSVIIPHLP